MKLSERGRGVYVRVGELAFDDVTDEVALLERIKEVAQKLVEGVARSPLYHEQKDTYTILRDAMKAWEDNAQ